MAISLIKNQFRAFSATSIFGPEISSASIGDSLKPSYWTQIQLPTKPTISAEKTIFPGNPFLLYFVPWNHILQLNLVSCDDFIGQKSILRKFQNLIFCLKIGNAFIGDTLNRFTELKSDFPLYLRNQPKQPISQEISVTLRAFVSNLTTKHRQIRLFH